MKKSIFLICYIIFFILNQSVTSQESNDSSESLPNTTPSNNNPLYTKGYNDGLKEGMRLCSESPRACGISLSSNTSDTTEEQVKEQCRQFPASCGIKVGPNNDGSTQEGIEQCRQDPESCNIELNPNKEQFIQEGIKRCQDDPADCDIASNDDGSTQAGIEQCRQDPLSCGMQPNTDGSTSEGITQCQNNPSSCGITVDNNTDGSTQEGIVQCQQDPSSCGINVNPHLNEVIQETMAQCQNNPAFCGIEITQCTPSPNLANSQLVHGFFSLSEGSLFLPAIDVPNIFDGSVTTYEAQMKIIAGKEPLSFTVTHVIPISVTSKQ